jgi:hypothetical protein
MNRRLGHEILCMCVALTLHGFPLMNFCVEIIVSHACASE